VRSRPSPPRPLARKEAARLTKQILKSGKTFYRKHAEEKMAERNLKKADVANILPYGRVVLEPESDVRGAFKYTFESNAMGTVIMFRGDSELSVITAYRKNWR
jgi:hypothetical protein